MQKINDFLNLINGYLGGSSWFVYLLLGTGLFFTFYLKFPQIRFFRRGLRTLFRSEKGKGETTHFQALSTALSGTIGTGNIGGVAFAIHLGGPAALFWMLVTAFLGMTIKFVEVTLSHKYRESTKDGTMAGGPMYYMKNKLNWKWIAILFSAATVISSFGTGSLPQINNIANTMESTFGLNKMLTGAVLAVLLFLVIVGGIRRIAGVTSRLVPLMAFVYLIGSLAVIFYNIENIIPSFVSIFSEVFSGTAATGGFLGASFAFAFNRGVNRGLFSNESGQGSAPIAHASAKTEEPTSEGMVAILEPFIDTIIVCTLTGLVLLSSGAWKQKFENKFQYTDIKILNRQYNQDNPSDLKELSDILLRGKQDFLFSGNLEVLKGKPQSNLSILHARSIAEDVQIRHYHKEQNTWLPFSGSITVNNGRLTPNDDLQITGKSLIHSAPLTTEAFKKGYFGDFGQYIVAIGLLLFAFSTAIAWSYYGDRAMIFLFGNRSLVYYRVVYVLGFFIASFTDTTIVWNFSEITIVLMTIPNLIGILWLHKDIRNTLRDYLKKEQ